MKTRFLALVALVFVSSALAAQRGPRYGDRYERYYYDENRYSYYDNYDYYRDRMDRQDRRELNRLIRRLEDRRRCALEDGYISRRERNRILDAQYDIDRLISRYRRPYRERYYRSGRGSCR